MINQMTLEEVNENITAINNASQDIGRRLLEMREREAWKVLGYTSWTAFLEGEFEYSRQHLYELIKAAAVIENLSTTVYKGKISTKAAAKLADYKPSIRIPILDTVEARYGKITESRIARVGDMFQEVTTTGHVDTGSGVGTPIDVALDKQDDEAEKRQNMYIYDKPQKPLTPDEIQLAISTITANPADQEVAKAVRSILRIQERKTAS